LTFIEIVDFIKLNMGSEPHDTLRNTCWRLREPQKVAPVAKSCYKIAEQWGQANKNGVFPRTTLATEVDS